MGILDNVKGMFSKRQKLADLKSDELKRARAQLEREQDRVMRQIDEIEKQKGALDAQGRVERSARKQKLLAEQMLQLESQAKHYDRSLALYSKQLRVVNGFLFLKENAGQWAATPLGAILSKMDTAELQAYVDQASVDGSLQLDKLNQLLGVFEEGEQLMRTDEEDKAVSSIVERWQIAQESAEAIPSNLEGPEAALEEPESEK